MRFLSLSFGVALVVSRGTTIRNTTSNMTSYDLIVLDFIYAIDRINNTKHPLILYKQSDAELTRACLR